MINSLEIKSGYATELPRRQQPFKFKKGINILFGPNGCGKSTVLNILGAYCYTKSGWSKIQEPLLVNYNTKLPISEKLSPGNCKAIVKWDGTPTLFSNPDISDARNWNEFFSEETSPDGMTGIQDQLNVAYSKPSSGNLRMMQIEKYYKALKNPPNLTKMPTDWENYNDVWQEVAKEQIKYFKSFKRNGPITILLDEPDRSLALDMQMAVWRDLIPHLAQNYQVIVATHSVFALLHTKANWFDFIDGYREKVLESLQTLKTIL